MNFFERAYEGSPLWETGRPQPEFVRLCDEGEILGQVLDVGCGTGENAIYFAEHGHPTLGIDFASNAVRHAESKSRERGAVGTRFRVGNALELGGIGERFDTVIDCGLFHTFLDKHRPLYARGLRSVLRPGGSLFLLCFSEDEPADWGGPRRVSQAELRGTFATGWRFRWVRRARMETTLPGVEGKAWLAALGVEPTEGPGTGPA
jgi:ubiquinone/menaquinone biosynthesis C-methylase UbiE